MDLFLRRVVITLELRELKFFVASEPIIKSLPTGRRYFYKLVYHSRGDGGR
jgi:hypothetical protein